MSSPVETRERNSLQKIFAVSWMPVLATVLAFLIGAIIIWITSGKFETVTAAYAGMINGAFIKTRGFSETLVATTPYILLGLAVALGFKTGLFNIGVEGQFFIGAVGAAWAGVAFPEMPAVIMLPLVVGTGAIGGAIWAAIPGYLKAKTGAHEVITTMMMNYIAFRLVEFLVNVLRDPHSSAVQTPSVSANAEFWSLYDIPARLQDPINAFGVAIVFAGLAWVIARSYNKNNRALVWTSALVTGIIAFVALPPLTQAWWPLTDKYDRLHIGLFLALAAAGFISWLLYKTTLGFEMRTVGANPDAAQYAGINSTRVIVLTMAISGALAGIAGTVEVLGVTTCRCLPLFFSSGYGFDSIAIALLANNNPLGIIFGSLLFGAMRNGADLMELNSGVSKYIISLIQALVLLFVAAPAMVRWMLRMRGEAKQGGSVPLTRGWGG
jgi:general nucleoside transport system permease protein